MIFWAREWRGIWLDKRNKPRTVNNFSDHVSLLSYFFSETYCGGYSGEDPPLPIPNREVKLTIADGTAPLGGRVGSCHFLIRDPDIKWCQGLLFYMQSQSSLSRSVCFRLMLNVDVLIRALFKDKLVRVGCQYDLSEWERFQLFCS